MNKDRDRNRGKLSDVCIIITAWNQIEKTLDCLKTVYEQDYPSYAVVVVDNGSRPDFQEVIQAAYPEILLLRNEKNLGFAGGYNVGIRYALEHTECLYLFLLNNDTLLAPNCLTELMRIATASPQRGLVTAKIYYAHDPQRVWTVGANFRPWLLELAHDAKGMLDEGQWQENQQQQFAPFCGVVLPRQVFTEVGLLDEKFFLYYEDMDYCRRLNAAGYEIWLAPAAKIWHAVSASSGGLYSPLERFWMGQSSGRYFRKHGRGWRLWLIIPYRLASALRTTGKLLRTQQWPALKAYWYGLFIGWQTAEATTPPPPWIVQNKRG